MPNPHVDFPAILRFVAAKHRVTEEAILSRSKIKRVNKARLEVYYLLSAVLTQQEISQLLNRHTSTVSQGIASYKWSIGR
jgi:hypothetical protein